MDFPTEVLETSAEVAAVAGCAAKRLDAAIAEYNALAKFDFIESIPPDRGVGLASTFVNVTECLG